MALGTRLSPMLRVLDDNRIVWLNLSGSGNETAGHLRQVNRMTLMFCALDGDAMILRVQGQTGVLHPRDAGWREAFAAFPVLAGSRQVFDMAVESVQISCGTGVPQMVFSEDRALTELVPCHDGLGDSGVRDDWHRKNTQMIDGVHTGMFAG